MNSYQSLFSMGKMAGPAQAAAPQRAASQPVQPLANEDAVELLGFLAVRPLHTAIMAGKVLDNGVESPLNRGTFYAYRNGEGIIEGVALIGHASLFEARGSDALKALARCAQNNHRTHLIVSEGEQFGLFWSYYANGGQPPRLFSSGMLLDIRWPTGVHEPVPGLRRATLNDLEAVLSVQAEMAYGQCYVNPLMKDPLGFRARVGRRIEQGRIYVWVEDGRLIFKADIMADTPEVAYLEGVWVNPRDRGRGHGLRCISQLNRELLGRTPSVCVFTSEGNEAALKLYRKAGYRVRAHYKMAYMQED